MSTERKVALKSLVDYTVGVNLPEINFKRQFKKCGEVKQIPWDAMTELCSNYGVSRMLEEGILYVVDEQDRIDLGLQEEAEKPAFIALTDLEVLKLLKSETPEKFAEVVAAQPTEQVKRIAHTAIKNKLTDYSKCNILKEACGIDILGAIQEADEA